MKIKFLGRETLLTSLTAKRPHVKKVSLLRVIMKNNPLLALICVLFLLFPSVAWSLDMTDTIAYKLAGMHTKNLNPGPKMMGYALKPSDAIVSEFQWILGRLKTRCLNPESALADTIVITWQTAKGRGSDLTLLDVARELSRTAQNTKLFGAGKVNFVMTSQYWTVKILPTLRKK